MDRILDSGSNDWGSTPHGDTITCLNKGRCKEIATPFVIINQLLM